MHASFASTRQKGIPRQISLSPVLQLGSIIDFKNGLKAPRLSAVCCFWDGGQPLYLLNATFAMHHDNQYRVIVFARYRAAPATPNSNTNTPFGFAERGVEASHGLDLTLHNWSRGQNAIENKSESESKRWEVKKRKKMFDDRYDSVVKITGNLSNRRDKSKEEQWKGILSDSLSENVQQTS